MKSVHLGVAIGMLALFGVVVPSYAGETTATMEKMKGETKATTEEVKGEAKGAVEDVKGNKATGNGADKRKGEGSRRTSQRRSECHEGEGKIIDALTDNLPRPARALVLMAHFGKEGQAAALMPKISQETLAEMIGTTRSRVSFFMNRFRKMGFVHYNGGLHVHSSLLSFVRHD